MKRIERLFLLFFLLSVAFNYAQNMYYSKDYFEKIKAKALLELQKFPKDDTLRVIALENVYADALFVSQREKVVKYADEAAKISKKLKYQKGLALYYCWKGALFRSKKDTKAAHKFYDSLINLKSEVTDKKTILFKAKGNLAKGNLYFDEYNFNKALKHFFLVIDYFDKENLIELLIIYDSICEIYMKMNNLAKAKQYANLMLIASKSKRMIEHPTLKGETRYYKQFAYILLIDIDLKQNNLKSANQYISILDKEMPDSLDLSINSDFYQKKGLTKYLEKNYAGSNLNFKKSYQYAKKFGHAQAMNSALFYLSKNALSLGNYVDAKSYADENLALAKEDNNKNDVIGALKNLSEYYYKTGNNKKAHDLFKEATLINDSLISKENFLQINTLQTIYETEKNQSKILELNIANEKKSNLNKILIGSSIGLLLIVFLGYRNFRNKQKLQNLKISELEKDKQLHAIDAMLRGQEEERGRIAKDLHDGLGGLLSGTKLSFTNIKENLVLTPENAAQFEKSLSMLDTTIADLRKVAHNLMPEALVKFGLNDALKDFCSSIQLASNITVDYQKIGLERKLGSTAETFIYRIIQELVNNAVKHAQATEILVQVAFANDKIVVTVEDNGIGYNKNQATTGDGLDNIAYRVKYLNGKIDTVTSLNNGTSVNIELNA
jgi:signal transduction histidine kinase